VRNSFEQSRRRLLTFKSQENGGFELKNEEVKSNQFISFLAQNS
jgi:hypothetical protein